VNAGRLAVPGPNNHKLCGNFDVLTERQEETVLRTEAATVDQRIEDEAGCDADVGCLTSAIKLACSSSSSSSSSSRVGDISQSIPASLHSVPSPRSDLPSAYTDSSSC